MPRPISWLPILHDVRRRLHASVRTHYDRREIESLFQLQPRAAQLLIKLLPATAVGRSRLVEREALINFLDRIDKAEDPSTELKSIKYEKTKRLRRRLRTLVRRDEEMIALDALPSNIKFTPGKVTVEFDTIEQLAEAMFSLARAMDSDFQKIAERYEVRTPQGEPDDAMSEYEEMMRELEAMERIPRAAPIPPPGPTTS